ncbi:hypothetical protein BP6252_08469 [Coleophoma cylindrospora]|uniref:R3H-associated N-terminal domain-containing protein n=1 Tax=Coleophoma cylindrospora TaxID=1849047 RepID=A0A3D8R5X9_9HELO|nr:hypothetical protein BP6252_08469 [Coleophoma cylindrospora]
MAIYNSVPPPQQPAATPQAAAPAVDVESWTVSALQSLNISPIARGTGVALSIPLDSSRDDAPAPSPPKVRRERVRRDSQKHREALLKGKEGSRRRQRWENDRLLHVPNAQPPLPSDWEVRPTYRVHTVPYYLAPLWENGVRHRAEEIAAAKKAEAEKRAGIKDQKGRVPQDLRQKMKKAKGAKTLLQELEEEVRNFVRDWDRKSKMLDDEDAALDSEDEEIVFIGRNGTMSDEQRKTVEEELEREKLVFDSLADDHGASFGRWLVHSIAAYYGLSSRSITVGNRREAYVGIKEMKTGRRLSSETEELPRPLWGML